MAESLRHTTVKGLSWTFAKNLSLQLFGFVQGIILARLLNPSDYGLIAMTQIFFSISACFIDSGFTSALIRKKDRTEMDYSTVFLSNVFLTLFFASLLVVCAPLIANFYHEPILTKIVRANAILLVLNSLNATQGTRMSINLDFKSKSIIGVIVNVTVGIACIICAYCGLGVWSLIYPNYIAPFLYLVLYWHYQHWRPKLQFSWIVWKEHFSFGSKLLASSLINEVFKNIYSLIIGKAYSATDLGFYSKADGYAKLPTNTINGVIRQVTYPILSSVQNDEEALKKAYRRLIRVSGFIVFPIMFGLAALSEPLVIVLIKQKWASSIPYLRILCFAHILWPIQSLNLNLLYVKGRSDLVLKLEIVKKALMLMVVLCAIPFGIIGMCIGAVIYDCIAFCLNTHYTGKFLEIGLVKQLNDLLPSFVLSVVMAIVVYFTIMLIPSMLNKLIWGFICGVLVYFIGAWISRSSELDYIVSLLKEEFFVKNESR